MIVHQRDVLLLNHSFDSPDLPHPFIVLSISEANQLECTFIAVMITSSEKTRDEFSFDLTDEMFEKPLAKNGCHARLHLITSSYNTNVIKPVNRMRPLAFNQLMADIGDLIFNYRFTPQ